MQEDFEEQNREIVELDTKVKQCESPALVPNLWCARAFLSRRLGPFELSG
jgi:hypothetical protein